MGFTGRYLGRGKESTIAGCVWCVVCGVFVFVFVYWVKVRVFAWWGVE